MKNFLSKQSIENLIGVHPDLIKVVYRAIEISEVDFAVLEGMRTIERQKQLVVAGASWTLEGRHLDGHAVDLGAWIDGIIDWSWPLYYKIAAAMKQASKKLGIPIEWGGDWSPKKKDGPHFQLSWEEYPSKIGD